jgi:hypothetical protein
MLAGAGYYALSTKEFYNINQDSFNINWSYRHRHTFEPRLALNKL